MQLRNSQPNQLLDGLQDIVDKVQIQSNFCISHPNYKPLELQKEAVTRFQQLPEELQRKYLSLQLRNFLYSIYFKGDAPAAGLLQKPNSEKLFLPQLPQLPGLLKLFFGQPSRFKSST